MGVWRRSGRQGVFWRRLPAVCGGCHATSGIEPGELNDGEHETRVRCFSEDVLTMDVAVGRSLVVVAGGGREKPDAILVIGRVGWIESITALVGNRTERPSDARAMDCDATGDFRWRRRRRRRRRRSLANLGTTEKLTSTGESRGRGHSLDMEN